MHQTKESITLNLRDAGCKQEMIEKFMEKYQDGNVKEAEKILQCHRCSLLDDLHASQKKIDCLDYLVYQMKKYLVDKQGGLL